MLIDFHYDDLLIYLVSPIAVVLDTEPTEIEVEVEVDTAAELVLEVGIPYATHRAFAAEGVNLEVSCSDFAELLALVVL